jgi:hypothetical protein
MKKLLLIAALVAAPAMADSWAMPNQSGGEIVVTDKPCPGYKNLRHAYTYTPSGKALNGCWYLDDTMIKLVWDDGTTYAYPADNFYQKFKTKKGQQL